MFTKTQKKWHLRRRFYPTFCLTPVAPYYLTQLLKHGLKFTTQQQQADCLFKYLDNAEQTPKVLCGEGWIGGVVDKLT